MTPFQQLCLVLADAVLFIHAAFIAFVVVGLGLIWVGWILDWPFVRNPWYRATHVAAIGVVVAESLLKFDCPLTTWENELRGKAGDPAHYAGSFVQAWVHRLIFYNLNERTFTLIYVLFFLAVIVTFWLIPPRWKRRNQGTQGTQAR